MTLVFLNIYMYEYSPPSTVYKLLVENTLRHLVLHRHLPLGEIVVKY